MAEAVSAQVVVQLGDAAHVRADLFVVPSTTQGGFGEPWRAVVTRLGVRGPGQIEPGGVELVKVPTAAPPVRYLGFAATVDRGQPSVPSMIEQIGRRLGELTRTDPTLLDLATPSLGTGVGKLDPRASFAALANGFVSTAQPAARLRIVEIDPAKASVLSEELSRWTAARRSDADSSGSISSGVDPSSADPDEGDALHWHDLTGGAQDAISYAEGIRRRVGSSHVHMEQLVIALHRAADDTTRARLGRVDAQELAAVAASFGHGDIPADVTWGPLDALPQLSRHVEAALAGARRSGRPVTSAGLLDAALAIEECSFIAALRARIGGRGALLANPAADTVPDQNVGQADRLDLSREVEMLATVALDEHTPLPLAVGLFGEWGSGKSFFMAMLRERLGVLSALAREGRPEAAPFCKNIRQIQFNAWHYVDGNLWASLAATIFDGLVDSPLDEVKRTKADKLGQATQAAIVAEDAVLEAERELRSAQVIAGRASTIARSAVPAAVDAVRNVADLEHRLQDFGRSDHVDLPTERLVGAVESTSTFLEELDVFRRLVRGELATRRRRATLIWLAAVVVLVGAVVAVGQLGWWGNVLTVVVGLLSVLTPALVGASHILRLARSARERREEPVVAAEEKLALARRDRDLAAEEVTARMEDLARLRNRGQRLHDLVSSARSEYGAKLSMMSQLRKDFEQLTWLLQNESVLPDSTQAGPPPEQLRAAAARVSNEGSGQPGDSLDVDRIVLYIDDLDRCPAEEVVKVLQAVNLLLTFKLFVVVIGVDGRWLEASLRACYDKLLESPRDYLEKIIQLPFVLRPMSPDGYSALVASLTPAISSTDGLAARTGAAQDAPALDGDQAGDDEPTPMPGPAVADPGPVSGIEVAMPKPESLNISSEERLLLGQIGALITTPRATKRLVNTYRMLRVCAGDDDADRFSPKGGGEYRAVIVLLALQIGCPGAANAVFGSIVAAGPTAKVWTLLQANGDASDVVRRMEKLQPVVDASSIEAYQRWVPLVSRFTYQLGSVIAPTASSV